MAHIVVLFGDTDGLHSSRIERPAVTIVNDPIQEDTLSPRDSSFLIHAIIARHDLHGGFYPIGGASMIARTQIPAIQQTGGDVFTYAEVSNIVLHHDQVQGVTMSDGHVIKASIVVLSMRHLKKPLRAVCCKHFTKNYRN